VTGFLLVVAVAGTAALASFAGGLVGGWRRPSTLLSSVALGLAGGVLLGAVLFEMLPRAEERSSVALAAVAFLTGVGAMFAFDLVLRAGAPPVPQPTSSRGR
jgi:ZIP family zinc transporter